MLGQGLGAILERLALGDPEPCVFIACSRDPVHCTDPNRYTVEQTDTLLFEAKFVMQVLQDLQQADSVAPPWQSCENSRTGLFLIQVSFVSIRFLHGTLMLCPLSITLLSRNNFGAPYPVSRTWRSDKMPSW